MELQIHAYRDEIIATIRNSQVTIIVGETGSGKTTQLPKFLYEACFSTEEGVIGITEPRRIAATSVAEFVAGQLGTDLGDLVGYKIRHDVQSSTGTKIRFMTDGILLRELQDDPMLSEYSVIMIDEAHERSVNIDFLLGLVKDLLVRRPDLKLVVSSATIDTDKSASYFADAPVIEVSGRTFPVDVEWGDQDFWRPEDLYAATAERVIDIHRNQPAGDILVFMPGADQINRLVDEVEHQLGNAVLVLPAHGGVPPQDQAKIFRSYSGKRKIVVATNIAETSITIDGIVYVVDTGLIKQTHFHSNVGIQSLDVVKHSQAGCNQRTGRAGRTRPGKCYRMFTEEDFGDRLKHTEPEIRRTSLAGVVLSMENIGITNVEGFDFIDPPEKEAFHEAYQTLIALGAVHPEKGGLTKIGRDMARLPLEPRTARMVLEAQKHGCVREIVTVAAFMSARNVFARPRDREWEADAAHRGFKVSRSDALTFLRVWKAYQEAGFDRNWCFEHFLNGKALAEVRRVRSQLLEIMSSRGELTSSENEEAIMKSVAAGLVQNLFQHASRHAYSGVLRSVSSFIFPGSSVFGRDPRWFVCAEVMMTSKPFARMVSSVEVEWLTDLAPNHFYEGPVRLKEVSFDGDAVTAVRSILQRKVGFYGEDREVGTIDVELSIEEAVRLQSEAVKAAELAGYKPMTFREERGGIYDWMTKKVTVVAGEKLEASYSGIQPEVGPVYYGSIQSKRFGEGREAVLHLKLLSLPGYGMPEVHEDVVPTPVVIEEEPEVESEPVNHCPKWASDEPKPERRAPTDDALAALAARFNN